jgi:hypothetical protein
MGDREGARAAVFRGEEKTAGNRRNEHFSIECEAMAIKTTGLSLLAAAGPFVAERVTAWKYVLLVCGVLNVTGCLSFTTRAEPSVPVSTVTRTETVYVTQDGTRVRRVVTVDASGRRYYVQDGRPVYVNHYEY